jgi:hypothetical protein
MRHTIPGIEPMREVYRSDSYVVRIQRIEYGGCNVEMIPVVCVGEPTTYGHALGEDTADIDAAECAVVGWAKWDGCSHFTFGEGRQGYLHVCGIDGWDEFTRAFVAMRNAVAECLGNDGGDGPAALRYAGVDG